MSNIPNDTNGSLLCEIREISHDFVLPHSQHMKVLENINLGVRPNEILALLGPSGCGKSTILRIVAGLLLPTSGEVYYRGEKQTGLNPKLSMVFQSFALYPWMTAFENVEAVLKAAGLDQSEAEERADGVIRMVGLAGFENSYPREMSGGMKQRVGIARALSVDPEMLLMDEPFSQVDALMAESLRAEVVDLWEKKDRRLISIVMVSHDIKEVANMADRIVILGAKPGRILTIVDNPLPRPRDYRSPEFLRLVDRLHEIITGHEMPDLTPLQEKEQEISIQPLPPALVSEIDGLLEYLDARGGKEDIFRIAGDTNRPFGKIMSVVKAAEMLDLVDTPKQSVILEPAGSAYVKAVPEDRSVIWRERLLRLYLFQRVHENLQKTEEKELEQDAILDVFAIYLPQENPEELFDTFVNWGRFAGLFVYDDVKQVLSLPDVELHAH